MTDLASYRCRRLALGHCQQGEAGFPLRQGDHGLPFAFAKEGVDFPVPQAPSAVHDGWTEFNALNIGQFSPPVIGSAALLAFLQVAEMLEQVPTMTLIGKNVLVDQFMADADPLLASQPAGELLWAPILPEQSIHLQPHFLGDPVHRFAPSLQCFLMSSERPIASVTDIASDLPTHCGYMNVDHSGNLLIGMTL